MQRSLALSLLGWMALAGCAESRPGPLTRTYLVSVIDGCPYGFEGFDLDGRVGTGGTMACTDAEDGTSPSGVPGIDRRLNLLECALGPPIDERIAPYVQSIAAGEYLLLIEVSDIDSFEEDGRVEVRMFLGRTDGDVLLEDGMAIPGQTFAQRGDDVASIEGSIAAGTLAFESPVFPIISLYEDAPVTVSVHDARLRARISGAALSEGEVGGRTVVSELVAIAPMIGDTIRDLMLADLDPDPADETVCRGVSAGFGFAAVLANPEAE